VTALHVVLFYTSLACVIPALKTWRRPARGWGCGEWLSLSQVLIGADLLILPGVVSKVIGAASVLLGLFGLRNWWRRRRRKIRAWWGAKSQALLDKLTTPPPRAAPAGAA
jgi:hypothetical protein